MTATTYVAGRDVAAGQVIDCGKAGFVIAGFTPYDSPLEHLTGPGRIAHALTGEVMAVYDNHPVRLRTPPETLSHNVDKVSTTD